MKSTRHDEVARSFMLASPSGVMIAGMNDTLLLPTGLLDFDAAELQALVASRRWKDMPERQRIGAVYDFVRNDISFGYNSSDDIPASGVLRDGYGQCNTKSTLLMALLRASGIPCRFHGFTIHKGLQKGVVTGLLYTLAPREILHSWVEVYYEGRWVELEGVILDDAFLDGVRKVTGIGAGPMLGYAVGTETIESPPIAWTGEPTFIQRTGIERDLGVFDDPDAFYRKHGSNLGGVKRWLFANVFRHLMNERVQRLRAAAHTKPAVPTTVGAEGREPCGLT